MPKFDGNKIIMGAISIVIGLILLPLIAGFVWETRFNQNTTGQWNADTNITNIAGLTALIDLVLYGFAFGLVGLGIALIYIGFKKG